MSPQSIRQKGQHILLLVAVWSVLASNMAGCIHQNTPTSTQSIGENAAASATAMLQQAEATALLLKAQLQATQIVMTAQAPVHTLQPPAPQDMTNSDLTQSPSVSQAARPTGQVPTVDNKKVVLLGVSIGGDGGFISVEFLAPPPLVDKWYAGSLYVIDEATGVKYDNIPVMETIGPLFSKPKFTGQGGYVMFYNINNVIKTGSVVTVVLSNFKAEHVTVK